MYFITLIYDYSKFYYVYLLKNEDVFRAFHLSKIKVENHTNKTRRLRLDKGSEHIIINNFFKSWDNI